MPTPDLTAAVSSLAQSFSGRLLRPADAGYDDARKVHNGLIDKRPALIAQCRGTADIADAVTLGVTQQLEIAVRGGGHNVAGRATVDKGLMIDLSLMRSVLVDPRARIARVEGGATWREFYRESQRFGLATTGGVIGSTGVAGLTLGGGLGWLMPKHGMALDNLNHVDLVLADGRSVRASEDENRDLFWAVRGGGGNFGVAASFEFRLHHLGPMVMGGMIAWPAHQAKDVLRLFRDVTATLTDDTMLVTGITTAPDRETRLAVIVAGHFGPESSAAAAFAPLKKFSTPLIDMLGPIPYVQLNGMLDAGFPKGGLSYWKSHFMEELSDAAIDTIVERADARPGPIGEILLEHFHGAPTKVPIGETAFALRASGYNCLMLGQWQDPKDTDTGIGWVRQTDAAMQRFVGKKRYMNYLGDDEPADAAAVAAYGPNLARLRRIKSKYDPQNVFHLNVNVRPE